ncbi:MAG: 5-oxoprolinase subunit PxpA, partial [Pseudomonadota bacterium]
GESFGAWRLGQDEELLGLVTSVNVACGWHAGDPVTMARTVCRACERGVAVGAHPGFPDLQGFGRRIMGVTPEEAYGFVLYQIGALAAFVRAAGARLVHVKPHGALYNMATKDRMLADAIGMAVRDFDPNLVLVALSGSELLRAGEALGLRVAAEAFADRGYEPDGSLTPRIRPGAVVENEEEAVARTLRLIKEGVVRSSQGVDVAIRAETICVHGDQPNAAILAWKIRQALEANGVELCSLAVERAK